MAVELLIRATSNVLENRLQKGEIVTQKDAALIDSGEWPWGNLIKLPEYILVRISDATVEEVMEYRQSVEDTLSWELQNSNANGRRYRVYIDPKILAIRPGMRSKIRDVLVEDYGATVRSADLENGEAVFDIPNPVEGSWADLRNRFVYDFQQRAAKRRYKLSSAAVDQVVAAGGWVEVTRAQFIANLEDRLA